MIFGNKDLIKFCNESGISMQKMRKCNIEKMGDIYVFVLSKNHGYGKDTYLEHDLKTQPDVVLLMMYDGNNKFNFETTEKTERVLNI